MSNFVFGQKVGVNLGGADLVGFVVGDAFENKAGETKYPVQVGNAIHTVSLREAKDRDSAGAGLTFWLL